MTDPESVPAVVAGMTGLAGIFGLVLRLLGRAHDRADTANERTYEHLRDEITELRQDRDSDRREIARLRRDLDSALEHEEGWRQRCLAAELLLLRNTPQPLPQPFPLEPT